MPVCEILSSRNMILASEKAVIADKLTPLLPEAEGLEDNPHGRSICFISFSDSCEMFVGGVQSDSGKIVVKISIFADAYSEAVKKELFQKIKVLFEQENSVSRQCQGNNIWSIIQPVLPNDFGVAGESVSLEMTKAFVNSYVKEF